MKKAIKLELSDQELQEYNYNKKEYNIEFSQMKRTAINKSKLARCYLCGKECSSFCNSHSIPRRCLATISSNGKLFNSLVKTIPFVKNEKGINEAGTFHIICNECDNLYFKEYESFEEYGPIIPSGKVLAEIALKNNLLMISKRLFEKQLYIQNYMYSLNLSYLLYLKTIELDLKEYQDSLKRAKAATNGHHNQYYYCFYYRILDYVVPFACQSGIALSRDLEGKLINDTADFSEDNRIQSMHICVFPTGSKTILIMFIDSKDKKYKNFYKQFNRLSDDDKLAVINYIVFAYTENVFLSNQIKDEVLNNKELIDVCVTTDLYLVDNISEDLSSINSQTFDFNKRFIIPNLLLKEYAINTNSKE